ncbi:MAG: DUF1573 domain-containing protein [Thermoanaerobaculia bacterium]
MPQFETSRTVPTLPAPRCARRIAGAAAAAAVTLLGALAALPARAQTSAPAPGAPAAVSPADATRKPKLTIEERVHETGEVARDKVVEHSFKIRNTGDAPLVIEKTIAGPNIEVLSKPATLAPGESGEIRVRVALLTDRPLALLKQVELSTNDPDTPSVVLELRILSTEYVVSKPGYARWIAVQKEKPGTISQKLVAKDGQDFELLKTSDLPLGITSQIKSTRPDPAGPREWQVDLTLGTDAPVGPIVGTLLLYVNHPKQSIVPIPLSGFMRPVVAVTPPQWDIGEIALTKVESQAFFVKVFSTEPIHVTKAEHDFKGIAPATILTMTLGREYKVKLDFDPATAPKGPLHGTLRIFTDSPKMPMIAVPIDATIK